MGKQYETITKRVENKPEAHQKVIARMARQGWQYNGFSAFSGSWGPNHDYHAKSICLHFRRRVEN